MALLPRFVCYFFFTTKAEEKNENKRFARAFTAKVPTGSGRRFPRVVLKMVARLDAADSSVFLRSVVRFCRR